MESFPYKQIEQKLREAVVAILPDVDLSTVSVRPCPDPKFGDYQASALIALAKARKLNPRQLATEVLQKLDVSAFCEPVEVAGAGFLNFRLAPAERQAIVRRVLSERTPRWTSDFRKNSRCFSKRSAAPAPPSFAAGDAHTEHLRPAIVVLRDQPPRIARRPLSP